MTMSRSESTGQALIGGVLWPNWTCCPGCHIKCSYLEEFVAYSLATLTSLVRESVGTPSIVSTVCGDH